MAKGLNLAEIDRVSDEQMNSMLWKAVKGENAKAPVPVRAAFVKAIQHNEDED